MSNDELLAWLKIKREYINIASIAREVDMPVRTLNDWMNSKRPLPVKYTRAVVAWVKEFLEINPDASSGSPVAAESIAQLTQSKAL